MENDKKLFKKSVVKDNRTYTDLYVSWTHNNKVYFVRVRPVFGHDYDKLIATAEPLPE